MLMSLSVGLCLLGIVQLVDVSATPEHHADADADADADATADKLQKCYIGLVSSNGLLMIPSYDGIIDRFSVVTAAVHCTVH